MKPIKFNECNLTLLGREIEGKRIRNLPAYSDGKLIMSCWKMNFKDRIKAFFFGTIWLQIRAQDTHPPVAMICDKNGFEMH